MMLDWLIVGGGIHGTHLSLVLTAECGVPHDRVRVLDPHDAPLARWNECTSNTGMRILRSPFVHQLDPHPFALRHFARRGEARRTGGLVGYHRRPALDLFRMHCDHLVREHRLDALRVRGSACGLAAIPGGWRVETGEGGALEARRVVLAIGMSDQPAWPDWARAARDAGAPVNHVFDPGFRLADLPGWEHAVVLGAGITGVQVALALGERQPGTVTLAARHPVRLRPFDSDPGWLGPREMEAFARERAPERRREMIRRARHRGSVPPDVARQLRAGQVRRALESRRIAGEPALERGADGAWRLVDPAGEAIRADRVVLATGFEGARPGGAWLDAAVEAHGLRVAPCGFPVPDRALRWAPGLHLTGPLAELELGPTSRNIAGARAAGRRLARAA